MGREVGCRCARNLLLSIASGYYDLTYHGSVKEPNARRGQAVKESIQITF